MLQSWTPIQQVTAKSKPTSSTEQHETPEKREHRLRGTYERALSEHRNGNMDSAYASFSYLVTELSDDPTPLFPDSSPPTPLNNPNRRATKRLRATLPIRQPSANIPEWQRRLRYLALRNLAETCVAQGNHNHALIAFCRALEDDNSDLVVWLGAARASVEIGHLHIARRAYEAALAMRPGHWLSIHHYRALLTAIGDADDDVAMRNSSSLSNFAHSVTLKAQELAERRANALKESLTDRAVQPPESLQLAELSWSCLVDVLKKCLQHRLSGRTNLLVAHPVRFTAPPLPPLSLPPQPQVQPTVLDGSQFSDEVVVVAQSRHLKRKRPDNDAVNVDLTSENDEVVPVAMNLCVQLKIEQNPEPSSNIVRGLPVASDPAKIMSNIPVQNLGPNPVLDSNHTMGATVTGEGTKKPEIRRSARRVNAAADTERRTTRTTSESINTQREDSDMVKALVRICYEEHTISSTPGVSLQSSAELRKGENQTTSDSSGFNSNLTPQRCSEDVEPQRKSTWKQIINEHDEAVAVAKSIQLAEASSYGPVELLLHILKCLSKIQVVQYFSTLALLWLTMRDRLEMNAPDSLEVSVLIVETLIVSAKKISKQKQRKFREAGRLLSQITVPISDEASAEEQSEKNKKNNILRMRIAWVWGILHDCWGEMQLSFQAAERTLETVRHVRKLFDVDVVPDTAGSDLSGYTWDGVEKIIQARISRIKSARDLEKAQEELHKSGSGDNEAPKRSVTILAPSVRISVRTLALDKWSEHDFKTDLATPAELDAWETRLEAQVDLEPRLTLLCDACLKAGDIVGELVCFSVRLRMAVHNYSNRIRLENDPNTKEKDSGTDSHNSSSSLMSDLLIQIRRYAGLIKRVSSNTYEHLYNDQKTASGWSMAEAVTIATSTIITLTQLLISMIPLAKHSSAAVELGAMQKNRRLGFTRCMLAFPRCVLLVYRCQQASSGEKAVSSSSYLLNDSALTRKMLYITYFCLRALEARGCCREEGTSGALIKMYARYLSTRLGEIASNVHASKSEINGSDVNADRQQLHNGIQSTKSDADSKLNPTTDGKGADIVDSDDDSDSSEFSKSEANYDMVADRDYDWWDVRVIRHELAQCFECLYQIPELESVSGDSTVLGNERWLENACRVSKHIGLAFIGGDSSGKETAMDLDVCQNIYFFYRKRIFEAVCLRRRDGGRVKRLREVLSRLAGALPEDAPDCVRMLSFHALDTLVSDVVDSNEDVTSEMKNSATRIENEWNKEREKSRGMKADNNGIEWDGQIQNSSQLASDIQLSIMYFEVFSLHALSIFDAYESEYKKQKNAERRKRPKEVADRVLSASSECLVALRCRPWSIGAWILLGRIFVEISDLALDERELCFSSFGLYHPEDIVSFGDGESIQTIFGRAEACFGFAESLARSRWANTASMMSPEVDVATVLGSAYDGNDDELWYGFGDDMDLFGALGLSNDTTSRPFLRGEPHPALHMNGSWSGQLNNRQMASIHLGSAALQMLRLRELRYFHMHWTQCSLDFKAQSHPTHQFPGRIVEIAKQALKHLRDGLELYGSVEKKNKTPKHQLQSQQHKQSKRQTPDQSTEEQQQQAQSQEQSQSQPQPSALAQQLQPHVPTSTQQQANVQTQINKETGKESHEQVPKVGASDVEDTKDISSMSQNSKQPEWRTGYCALAKSRWYYSLIEAKLMRKCGRPHVEYLPVFQRALNENTQVRALQKLPCDIEPLYKLHCARMKVLRTINDSNAMSVLTTLERFSFGKQKPIIVDVDDVADEEDSITVRRNAVAEDILSAMQACCENRNGIANADFFFKSTFCRAILLSEVLRDVRVATSELSKLFRVDAAARVLDSGLDGIHRGYFYKMWNYRYTDTGMEPAVETERKLVRWRAKLLGLYGSLLKEGGEWRLLAAIIVRLRKRVSEDLPVDGAVLDDLIEAYAHCRRASLISSMERGIVTDAAAFEASFQTTWHIYTETLRLSHAARRVRITVMREEQGGAGEERLVQSGRPRCLVAIHSALRVEYVRWMAAVQGVVVDMQGLRDLPSGGRMNDVSDAVKAEYTECVKASADKWALDEGKNKMLARRLADLSGVEG